MNIYYVVLCLFLIGCNKKRPLIKVRRLEVHVHHYSLADDTKELHDKDEEENGTN